MMIKENFIKLVKLTLRHLTFINHLINNIYILKF